MSSKRKCRLSPDSFCYICGYYIGSKQQKHKISPGTKLVIAYSAYSSGTKGGQGGAAAPGRSVMRAQNCSPKNRKINKYLPYPLGWVPFIRKHVNEQCFENIYWFVLGLAEQALLITLCWSGILPVFLGFFLFFFWRIHFIWGEIFLLVGVLQFYIYIYIYKIWVLRVLRKKLLQNWNTITLIWMTVADRRMIMLQRCLERCPLFRSLYHRRTRKRSSWTVTTILWIS